MLDLVIRNAFVYDGSGMPGYRGEIGIRDGRTVRVGRVPEVGVTEIDAGGLAAAPGFVDVHTHYDAQLCWDGLAQPIIEHGVTTVVTGNCSLTLAPLREEQRGRLCRMFRQIEDLPMAAFDDGIDWQWETFDGYLDALTGQIGLNVAPLVGHSAIRMWVMGEDAFHREATADVVAAMQEVLAECLRVGASGLSTSYVSRKAAHTEIEALCETMGEVGHGLLQIVPEFYDTALMCKRVDMLADLSIAYGVSTTLSPLFHSAHAPEMVETVLTRVQEQAARGSRVWPQVQTRPIDINFRLRERNFMLMALPSWFQTLNLPTRQEKVARFSDPEWKAKLIAEAMPDGDNAMLSAMRRRLEKAYVRGVRHERNTGLLGRRLGDIGRERGVSAAEAMIDIALDENLETEFKNDGSGTWTSPWSARCCPTPTCSSARPTPAPTSRPSPPTATPATCSASSSARRAPSPWSGPSAASPTSRPSPGACATAACSTPATGPTSSSSIPRPSTAARRWGPKTCPATASATSATARGSTPSSSTGGSRGRPRTATPRRGRATW